MQAAAAAAAPGPEPPGSVGLVIEVTAPREITRLSVVGNAEQLGRWAIADSVMLAFDQEECAGGRAAPRGPGFSGWVGRGTHGGGADLALPTLHARRGAPSSPLHGQLAEGHS